jgi:NTE family protein
MAAPSTGPETFAELKPETIGTKLGDLVTPCSEYQGSPVPPSPTTGFPLAIALSGGGFRATLASIGVLRFLADAGVLGQVRHVSSVSGGSIANGLFAMNYPGLAAHEFSAEAFVELVQAPAIRMISTRSLSSELLRNFWRLFGPKNRTTLLADAFDRWFFHGLRLHDLPPPCRFVFNAADLTTGVRFGFEREFSGDYVLGRVASQQIGLRLADAIAISAAVPGLLATYSLKAGFPCANGRVAKLVDGGAYENTALEPVDDLPDHFLVAMNAGGIFRTGPLGWIPIVKTLQRSEALLYRQSTGLRMRQMVERFRLREKADREGTPPPAQARWGVLFGLATTPPASATWTEAPLSSGEPLRLSQLKTSFAQFSRDDCVKLVRQAWWLTGASIAAYHPNLLTGLPAWRDLP